MQNLKKLNSAQNEQSIYLRGKVREESDNNTLKIVQSLVDGLRASHVDFNLHVFDDSWNPQNFFFGKFDKLFKVKQIPNENRLFYLDRVFEIG